MKIGILTFHNAYNYGAILQTYATQELMKSMGYDVEVINYHNKKIDSVYNSKKFRLRSFAKNLYRFPLYLLEKIYYRKKREAYHDFLKHNIILSRKRYKQSENVTFNSYDIVLIGSDQLWNKKITGGFDEVYWGKFLPENTKKIAWSICMNNDNFTCEEKNYITKHLKNYFAITVREKSLQQFLKELTHIEYPQTLDPTLVLSVEKWEEVCYKVREKDYIAVYAVQDEEKTISFARIIASICKKKIIIIRANSKWYFTRENKEYAGPHEFLSYIRHADMVVTTSFHGSAFSIIFQKQFICPIFRENVRIESLLDSIGLRDRRVNSISEFENLYPIDYTRVTNKLNNLRKGTLKVWNSILIEK